MIQKLSILIISNSSFRASQRNCISASALQVYAKQASLLGARMEMPYIDAELFVTAYARIVPLAPSIYTSWLVTAIHCVTCAMFKLN